MIRQTAINWNDPALAIDWPAGEKIVSEKDRALPNLADVPEKDLPPYEVGSDPLVN